MRRFHAPVPGGELEGWVGGDGPPAFPWYERPGSVRAALARLTGDG